MQDIMMHVILASRFRNYRHKAWKKLKRKEESRVVPEISNTNYYPSLKKDPYGISLVDTIKTTEDGSY